MNGLTEIRPAIAAAFSSLDDVQVSGYLVAQPTMPTIQVLPGSTDYDQAFRRGLDRRMFTVQAFVAVSEGEQSQKVLDELMAPTGARSVKTLLEADRTFGGTVSGSRVISDSGYAVQVHPSGVWVLLCEWTLEVWTQ